MKFGCIITPQYRPNEWEEQSRDRGGVVLLTRVVLRQFFQLIFDERRRVLPFDLSMTEHNKLI
jgi:hypothetical protein